jgi:hypothetical protein
MKAVALLFKAAVIVYAAGEITDVLSHYIRWLKKLEGI